LACPPAAGRAPGACGRLGARNLAPWIAAAEDASVTIRAAASGDVDALVRLAAARRAQYETYQPVFWRPAADAAARQRPYLAGLIEDPAVIILVAVAGHDVLGFRDRHGGSGATGLRPGRADVHGGRLHRGRPP